MILPSKAGVLELNDDGLTLYDRTKTKVILHKKWSMTKITTGLTGDAHAYISDKDAAFVQTKSFGLYFRHKTEDLNSLALALKHFGEELAVPTGRSKAMLRTIVAATVAMLIGILVTGWLLLLKR
jgi:hypothetical protein